jgi:catechol 2,3-dioxygenase-like lactoylglutathione lyase family enzyme
MNEATHPSITAGVHHVGLTVPDLAQTRLFFTDLLAYTQVGEVPDYPAAFLTDGSTMITLWQVKSPAAAISFDRHNVIGLHHLALSVPTAEALDELYATLLEDERVSVEFAPEPLGEGPIRHMMCAIPGGIRVEFIATGS